MGYFTDAEFRERMLALMVTDRKFLRRTAGLLVEGDFAPQPGDGPDGIARQWIAKTALQYWSQYRQPIGSMLKTEAQDYIRRRRKKLGIKYQNALLEMVQRIRDPELAVSATAVETKILEYKQRVRFKSTIEELIRLQESGELDVGSFQKLARKTIRGLDMRSEVVDYGETLEQRIKRREKEREIVYPYLYISPVDEVVRMAPRGQIQMVLAKYGTGKSLFMVHLSQVMALQGYNVLYFTLEDPVPMVENRLDASLSGIKLVNLTDRPNRLRRRFEEQWQKMRAKIKIVNATGGSWTVHRMEELWETLRNRGFIADVVIVDYDKKVEPPHRYSGDSAERMHSSEIYSELTNWAARDQLFMWVAAQAKRSNNERKSVVIGDDVAEDINKLREAGFAIGIGMAPKELDMFGADGRYLYIAKNRFGLQMMGWPIIGDFERGIFYDDERTVAALEVWKQVQEAKKNAKPSRREE